MNIGDKIKYYRKERGLTQLTLASKANISRSYLADVENNRYNPSIDVVKSIANALGVPIDEFFKENDIPANDEIDKLEKEMKLLYSKIKNLSQSDRQKILKMIEIFDEENND